MSTGIVFIGRYRLINPVYMGATTQLWQGIYDVTGELFAVKFLQEQFRKDRTQIGYLKWEYTVGSQRNDEHVIRIVEFGTHRGIPFLAMEWFSGNNMKALIRQGIDASRILTVSRGKVPGKSENTMAKNRRAGFIVYYEK